MIHFGRNNDNDRAFNIIKGKMSLTQDDINTTFDRVVARTVDSCLKLLRGRKIDVGISLFLVFMVRILILTGYIMHIVSSISRRLRGISLSAQTTLRAIRGTKNQGS